MLNSIPIDQAVILMFVGFCLGLVAMALIFSILDHK